MTSLVSDLATKNALQIRTDWEDYYAVKVSWPVSDEFTEYRLMGAPGLPINLPESEITLTSLSPDTMYRLSLYGRQKHNGQWGSEGPKHDVRTKSTKLHLWVTDVTKTSFKLNWPTDTQRVIVKIDNGPEETHHGSNRWMIVNARPGQSVKCSVRLDNAREWNDLDFTMPRDRPTAPGYLGKFEHTETSVLLHWERGAVDGGKILYRVRRDELVLEETEDTAYRDLTPEQGRTYVYSVCTVDDQYNESDRVTLTLSFDDLTPPTEISNLRTTDLSVQVLWDPAYDSSGRIKYHVYLDGDHKGTTEETAFSITEMESGKRYQICVEAEDASGNKSEKECTTYPPIGIPLKHRQ